MRAQALTYEPFPAAGGSARSFHSDTRKPPTVTIHQPHGSDTIRQGTLVAFLRVAEITREEFERHLEKC